jgi:DNA-binding IclR family transcriptional regulator
MSGVQSVERAFTILQCLAGGPAGVSEVAERVELPKSTVWRLLSTLQELGAVEQSGSGTTYRIGDAMIDIAAGALPGRNIIHVARPHLVELVDALGEIAGLSVLDGRDVVYLDQVDADNLVQVRDWTGERLPAHSASSGLVLLAHLPRNDRERYLTGPLVASVAGTTIDAGDLRTRLDAIAARGVEWTCEEFVPGISSVAAPVFGAGAEAVAAVHAHGPAYRFPADGSQDDIANLVAETARRISARLVGQLDAVAT